MADSTHEAVGQQELVFMDATAIYRDRHELRGDAWEDFPIEDTIGHMESKMARCKAIADRHAVEGGRHLSTERAREALVDDAIDLINYTAFLVRRLTGRV